MKITWHFAISAVRARTGFGLCVWQLWRPKQLLTLATLAQDILPYSITKYIFFFQIYRIDLKAFGKKNEKKRKFANFSWWALVGFFLHPPFYIHVQKLPGFKVNFSLFLTVNCKKWRYLLARITTNKHAYSWKNNQLELLFKMGTFEGNLLTQFHKLLAPAIKWYYIH